MSKWLDWIKPARRRERPAPNPEQNDATLARLQDTDSVYRALMDHAYSQLENDTLALLQPKLTNEERSYLAGRASALAAYISNIEGTRERAKALAQEP
jgi:hypothetical protein